MNTTLIIYLAGLGDNLIAGLVIASFALIILGGALGVYSLDEIPDREKSLRKQSKCSLILAAVFIILAAFIPGSTTSYLMLGSSYLNSTEIPNKVKQIIEGQLDKIIKEK